MTVDVCVFQLKRQMDEEVVFVGFTEGEIDFQPTYKYDTGSDQWDTRSEIIPTVTLSIHELLFSTKYNKQTHNNVLKPHSEPHIAMSLQEKITNIINVIELHDIQNKINITVWLKVHIAGYFFFFSR